MRAISIGTVLLALTVGPLLSGCGLVAGQVVAGGDVGDCIEGAAAAAKADDRTSLLTPQEIVGLTTQVAAICMDEKNYECNAQTPAGEWVPGLPKEFMCMPRGGDVGTGITPKQVVKALQEAGFSLPATLS